MVGCDQHDKTIVVAGGFTDEERVESNNPDVDTSVLEARHEEADTRIILHCVKSQDDSIVVQARDTDILVLLLAHFPRMSCTKLWLKAGTAKKRKYIPVQCSHNSGTDAVWSDCAGNHSSLPCFDWK